MASATNALRANIINFFFRANPGGTVTAPASVKLGLYSTATTVSGGGTEIVAGAHTYARQTITFADPAGTGDSATSAAATFVDWPGVAASNWAIHDGVSGTMLMQGAFSTPQNTGAGTTLTITLGDLALQVR